ncbi:MAG: response regulator [Candidatus Omnitrophica bacterium]|nr:response regulator [Candidatus Omnitrophota bacterium]
MERKIQVLVVDDEVDFKQLLTFWLESKGYSAITASNGQDALKLMEKTTPDIVLLDIRMPVMDGIETLKRIRKTNKDLPVILISAYINDPKAKDVLSYGISGIFYKGKNFEEVLPLLESALRTHKRLK